MMAQPEVSLVSIFFNEEGNVAPVVESLIPILEKTKAAFELVLVNNGSHDKTGELLDRFAKTDPRLKIVHLEKNRGYGGGLLEGLNEASGKYLGYLCGDGQVRAEDILKVYEKLKQGGCDLAKVKRIDRQDGALRAFVSKIYNLLMKILFRCPSSDLNGTPKIFRAELLRLFDLRSTDWFIDAELMIKAAQMKLRLSEVPIVFHPRKEGESSVHPGTILSFLKNIFLFPWRPEYRQWKRRLRSSSHE